LSALVAMHGLWFLIAIPPAGVLAWRLGGRRLQWIAGWLSLLTAAGLCGWVGYLVFDASEYSETLLGCVIHGIGVITGMVDVPIVQFLVAALVVTYWPARWFFQPKANVATDQSGP
jgi:hypothetical protein